MEGAKEIKHGQTSASDESSCDEKGEILGGIEFDKAHHRNEGNCGTCAQ